LDSADMFGHVIVPINGTPDTGVQHNHSTFRMCLFDFLSILYQHILETA